MYIRLFRSSLIQFWSSIDLSHSIWWRSNFFFYSSTVGFFCPSSQRKKKYNTLWLKWVSCVRCYEPRISVRQCAAMSHCDLNIEMTGLAGLFGMFTKNTALCAFATALRIRHFALACLHFRATVLRERHVASLHALAFARVLTEGLLAFCTH